MIPELYSQVMVTQDVPEEAIKKGDTGWYIEFLAHPNGDAAMLEVGAWDNSRVVIVPVEAIAAIPRDTDATDESVKSDT